MYFISLLHSCRVLEHAWPNNSAAW